jgi:hypothetical protein
MQLKKHLRVIGLTCTDARQQVNSTLNSLMSAHVQTKVNVVYENSVDKSYSEHLSCKQDLPKFLAILLHVVSKAWNAPEKDLRKFMSDWQKHAGTRIKKIPI